MVSFSDSQSAESVIKYLAIQILQLSKMLWIIRKSYGLVIHVVSIFPNCVHTFMILSKIEHVNYRLLHTSATILTEVAETSECTPCWSTINTRIKNIKLFDLIWGGSTSLHSWIEPNQISQREIQRWSVWFPGKITVINQACQISQDKLGNGVFSTWLVILTIQHSEMYKSDLRVNLAASLWGFTPVLFADIHSSQHSHSNISRK